MPKVPNAKIERKRTIKRYNDTWVMGALEDLPGGVFRADDDGVPYVMVRLHRLSLIRQQVHVMGRNAELDKDQNIVWKWIGILL